MEERSAPRPTWGPGRSTNGSASRGTDGWQSPRPFSRGTGAPSAHSSVDGVKGFSDLANHNRHPELLDRDVAHQPAEAGQDAFPEEG